MIGTNRYIGSPGERIEDPRLLRGRGEFVGDLRREGMLHAAILRSPVAHGRIAAIDDAAALAIKGVRAVVTANEIGTVPRIPLRLLPLPGTERFLQPVIAADRVRYVGEPLAVVLADSAALAEDGVGAIGLDIDELAPVADRQTSARRETLLFAESGTNVAMTLTAVKGDADAAFRDADYVRRERFEVQRYTALPMEPRGILAEWDAERGRMTVLGAAKVPFFNRDAGGDAGAVAGPYRLDRERCRRRFWRARRVLSRGFPDPVRCQACRPIGALDRGSARASDGDEPCAPGRLRSRDRLSPRWHDPRFARRGFCRSRRLCPHQRPDRAAQSGAVLQRPIPRSQSPHRLDGALNQQDASRHLSWTRAL